MLLLILSLSLSLSLSQPVLEEVISKVREGLCSAVVVNAIINSFQPKFISQRALMFADLIKDCEETGLPKVHAILRFTPTQQEFDQYGGVLYISLFYR